MESELAFYIFSNFDKDRKSGRTALHLAAEEANLELIRLFLELPSCLSFVNAKVFLESFTSCSLGMIFIVPLSLSSFHESLPS